MIAVLGVLWNIQIFLPAICGLASIYRLSARLNMSFIVMYIICICVSMFQYVMLVLSVIQGGIYITYKMLPDICRCV